MSVSVEEMRGKLLTVPVVRKRLKATEPLEEIEFPMHGSGVAKFHLENDWTVGLASKSGTARVGAEVTINGTEYPITKDALLEMTSFIGITKQYASKTPANLLTPHLNYWYAHTPKKAAKALVSGGEVVGLTKASIQPYSNVGLMQAALDGIKSSLGTTDVMVDYKFEHNLRRTAMRLIVPGVVHTVRDEHPWSIGLDIQNSLTGEPGVGTSLKGYLFSWWCTNGATSTHATSGDYNRRMKSDDDAVYEWARAAVEEILGGMDHEFDALDEIAEQRIVPAGLTMEEQTRQVANVLQDVYETYRVPVEARERIEQNLTASDDLTMYGVMAAITETANNIDMSETIRTRILSTGGDLPRAFATRCSNCGRLPASH